jgi:MSHA biogenesis protein MshL
LWLHPLLVLAALALAACQSISPGWRDEVRGTMDEGLEEARAPGKPPAEVSQALLPPLEIALPEGRRTPIEPRFDLSVGNAPARQVFLGLVEGTKYSVVLHPDVRGALTLNLKETTVPEAFEAIRRVYGYEYRREGNRFLVLGREMQTRLYNVNYLNLVRKGRSDTRVSGGGIGQRTTSAGGTATSAGAGGTTGFSSIQVETQSQSEFWKDLQATLTALIGTEGGRKVIVNSQTGVVAARAMPDELRVIEDYLGATHATVNRQVILEAKIIEVELNDRFQSGINWAKVHSDFTVGQVGGGSTNLNTTGSSDIAGTLGTLRPGTGSFSPTTGTESSAFGGVFTLAVTGANFTAFVELLKAQGEVQVLSSPRVSTVNNQKAVIKIGADEFFVTGVSSTATSTGTTTVTTPTVELSSFFSGIVLDVTPQIDESSNIILHIHPSVSSVTEKSKSFTALGEAFNLPLAFSTIQESDNVVRSANGQIIVIGGLMKEGSTDEHSAVPLLADIPVVGNLFKHKRVTRIKKELVILLKPTVMNLDQDWGDAIGESKERIRKIRIGS